MRTLGAYCGQNLTGVTADQSNFLCRENCHVQRCGDRRKRGILEKMKIQYDQNIESRRVRSETARLEIGS